MALAIAVALLALGFLVFIFCIVDIIQTFRRYR